MRQKTLEVYYKGRLVGILAETKDRLVAFQYSDEWLRKGFSVSPFSLPLKPGVFVPKESARNRFHGLFGIFADSLPDSWGELLLDRYLKSIGIDSVSTLERLAFVGASGMGALEYVPSKHIDFSINGLDYDEVALECEKILASQPSEMIDTLFGLGGSGGGTRPKILITENGKDWIVKFPASKDPKISGKREYDYSLCARKIGIQMTETELVPSRLCDGFFRTLRFDRDGADKLFSATFAGLLEADFHAPSCDYSTYMRMINVLTRSRHEDLCQMYLTMCFNVLAHNRDDHTKNFSFLFDEQRGWRLSPSYDLTYSDTYYGEQTTSVSGKGKNINEEDLIKVGTEAGLKPAACEEMLQNVRTHIVDLAPYICGTQEGRQLGKRQVDELLRDYKDSLKKGR